MRVTSQRKMTTRTMVQGAVMTALVIIMQILGTYTAFFGPFSAALALVPIIIGAALCGRSVGAWLGLVFGGVVLMTGGAALFWAFDVPGTIITVLVKGAACGLAAGVVYKLLAKWNEVVATIASAVVCPIVNTGVFLLGSAIFFLEHAEGIADVLKMDISGMALFWALAMGNFLFEIALSIVLSPVVVRLLQIKKKSA